MTDNKYSEWRVLTPLLLAIISVTGIITGYLVVDKLNSMNDKSDKLFSIVGEVKTALTDYEDKSDQRFARLETIVGDKGVSEGAPMAQARTQ